jgi:hypothetical protein
MFKQLTMFAIEVGAGAALMLLLGLIIGIALTHN